MRCGQQSNLEWQVKLKWVVYFRWVVFLWQWQSIEWEIRKVVIIAIALYASRIVMWESMKPYLFGFDLWHACFRAPLRWMSLSWCARWTEKLWLLVRFPRCIAIRPEQQNHCQVRTVTFFLTDRQTVWLRRFWQWVTHWSLAIKSLAQQAKIEWIIGQMYQLAMPVLVKHLFCAVSVFFLRSSVGHCKPGNKIKIHCPSEHVLKSCYLCVHFLHWFVALAMGFVPVMV